MAVKRGVLTTHYERRIEIYYPELFHTNSFMRDSEPWKRQVKEGAMALTEKVKGSYVFTSQVSPPAVFKKNNQWIVS